MATQPRLEQRFWAGLSPREVEERVEESWREVLRKRIPALREERARLSPFQRGERPGVFAPRVQTLAL